MTTRSTPELAEDDELALNAYLDGELGEEERRAFAQRLAARLDLREAHARLVALRGAIGRSQPAPLASQAFYERITRMSAQAFAPAARGRRFGWPALAASIILSMGFGGLATYTLVKTPSFPAASAALVGVHRQILLAANPVEIASSDRHAIKPWFDAKLAMSPPVADLADRGFPLIGGRVGFVDGRALPVLVYRRNAHLISLVASPEAGGHDSGAQPTRATRDGYAVLTWRGPDFVFSAVSDVTEEDLADFVARLREAMKAGRVVSAPK